MSLFYQDNHITLYNKDCRSMSELPDDSIQCVVTSPPYWGLRKYAGEQDLIWGGDNHHEHEWTDIAPRRDRFGRDVKDINSKEYTNKGSYVDIPSTNTCSLCGAWRGAYGLEPTPELYVQHTIEILREIRRVLRKDGVVFWNIGDSYNSAASNQQGRGVNGSDVGEREAYSNLGRRKLPRHEILKPKDLCLIPFRVAIAAQEDGWWVRSVIIWSKNNPMPESVKDRPTESHEYILMLTKSSRYYWDQEAVRVKTGNEMSWEEYNSRLGHSFGGTIETRFGTDKHDGGHSHPNGRNLRSVWEFPTQPYLKAHFATFPEELPERCIKAASKEGDIILDPFAGSGTTLWVAKKLNRKAVGYEISKEYCDLVMERNRQQVIL